MVFLALLIAVAVVGAVKAQTTDDLTMWSHFNRVFKSDVLNFVFSSASTLSHAVEQDNLLSANTKSFGCASYANAGTIGK